MSATTPRTQAMGSTPKPVEISAELKALMRPLKVGETAEHPARTARLGTAEPVCVTRKARDDAHRDQDPRFSERRHKSVMCTTACVRDAHRDAKQVAQCQG